MKRWIVAVVCLVGCSMASEAAAWGFRARGVSVTSTRTVTRYTGSPQQVAQAKAARMAELGMRGHLGGGMGGLHYEGTGRGTSAAAALSACCFVGERTCAAAAVVKGRNGLWYAVRLFY